MKSLFKSRGRSAAALMRTLVVVIGLMAAFAPSALADDSATWLTHGWNDVDGADSCSWRGRLARPGVAVDAWVCRDYQTTGYYVLEQVSDIVADAAIAHGVAAWRLKSGAMSYTFGMWVDKGQTKLFKTPTRNQTLYSSISAYAFSDGYSWGEPMTLALF